MPNPVSTIPVTAELILAETSYFNGGLPAGVVKTQCAPTLNSPDFVNTLTSMLALTANETNPCT